MSRSSLRSEWQFEDRFSRKWRIFRVDASEREDASQPDWQTRGWIQDLVYSGFDHRGARNDALATSLLDLYDALTGAGVSRRLPSPERPTFDPGCVLRGMDGEIRQALLTSLATLRIGIERVTAAPWPFMQDAAPDANGPDDAPPAKHVYEILVVDDTGAPVPGARLAVTLAGRAQTKTTDASGKVTVETSESSDAVVSLENADDLRDKLRSQWTKALADAPPPGDQVLRSAISDTIKPFNAPADWKTTLVLGRPVLHVDVIEMEDIHFHFDSAVVLPWREGEDPGSGPGGEKISALTVIATALRYAKDNADKQLLLAGHTDSSGESDYNRKLSASRANATKALLAGDKSEWGKRCVEHQKVEDLQQVLVWLAEAHGWPCHPGTVDGEMGPKTSKARRAFRRKYNDDFSGSLALDGDTASADWEAILDLYDVALKDELGDDLSSYRGALAYYDPAILACGEDFAAGGNQPTGMRSASDRRVDLLFLTNGDPYPDFASESPPGSSIYGPAPSVLREYLPVDPPVTLELAVTKIEGLYKPGFTPDGESALKLSGYQEGYTSDDDQGRIFLNHVPRTDLTKSWDDSVKKDTQYVELEVSVSLVQGDKIPSDARVEWEWYDPNGPDHPEANAHGARVPDQLDVDGNPRSMLNRGACDYPKAGGSDMARFAQGGDLGFADGSTIHLCDTEIRDATSRVRFHVSNVSGDNFVLLARAKNLSRVAPSKTTKTGVMTAWKRIDVEYVRMENAFPLPVDKVAPYFEPARVQMDFAPERVVPSKPFLTKLEDDEDSAAAAYASSAKGEFQSEGKPGWFFLASAERASSENVRPPSSGASNVGDPVAYVGSARISADAGPSGRWEKLTVDSAIADEVSLVGIYDAEDQIDSGAENGGFFGVWKKEVANGKTMLHLYGIDYQSEFEVTKGSSTGLVGRPGRGGAYDKSDVYYPRHRNRQPSGAWEAGGFRYPEDVFIVGRPPGATETSGISPPATHAGNEYFAGRLVVFTRAGGATDLDEDEALATVVHEFTHAFGYPHKCGFYGWPQPPATSCSMNYFQSWLYAVGTRVPQRFTPGKVAPDLCSKHLAGVREVHIEDNPAMWKWT